MLLLFLVSESLLEYPASVHSDLMFGFKPAPFLEVTVAIQDSEW